ncbi:MAG TPA: ADOP family duplicated permease [Vicinamibacterales bacterium]|nr:ADOP family duplicated permease [Vicinamibacterales bacterium]
MIAPPRLPTLWLERCLHPDERDELIGDLAEQFRQRALTNGRAARRWYWRQALALTWRFAISRRDVISTSHERTRGRWALGNAATDWRYAWRSLRASRGFVAVAVLSMTFGIGLSSAVFSLVDGILLKPLAYPQADRIVRLSESAAPTGVFARLAEMDDSPRKVGASDLAIGVWTSSSKALELVTPVSSDDQNVTTAHGVEQVHVTTVGGAFFEVLGVQAIAGRLLQAADSVRGAPPAVVVSDGFWRRALDGRADVVGSTLTIEQDALTIVGVVPGSIVFPEPGAEIWKAGQWSWPAPGTRRNFGMSMDAIARLRPGVTVDDASTEAAAIAQRIADAASAQSGDLVPPSTLRVRRLQDDITAPIHGALVTLLVGMGLVLAAACLNLANLLVARNAARHREIAVRLALGASRWRIVRPLVIEQLILGAAGAVTGGLVGWWIVRSLPLVAPANLPRLADVRFNVTSLAFASGVSLLTAICAGLWPARQLAAGSGARWFAGRMSVGARATSAELVRRGLVVLQVALAASLLVGAVLIARSLVHLLAVNPGYRPEGVLTFQVGLPDGAWRDGRESRLYAHVLERLRQHPAVVAAGTSSALPFHSGNRGNFGIQGRPRSTNPAENPIALNKMITPGFLRAIGTRVIRGRDFTEADSGDAEKVAIVDDTLARRYFPNEDPIGQTIEWSARRVWKVVGIVEASHHGLMTSLPQPTLYLPALQLPDILAYGQSAGGVVVRTTGDPLDLAGVARSAVQEIEPTFPLVNVVRLEDRLDETFAEPRFFTIALAMFALLALSTAVLGVFGVLSYSVERRRVEFGVRRALGAEARHIASLVIGQGLLLSIVGVVAGLSAAALGAGVMRSLLFGIGPLDPVTFLFVPALIVLVAAAASWQPARRALRVDPAQALRNE